MTASSNETYLHHRLDCAPRQWKAVADALDRDGRRQIEAAGGTLYGIWRSQIGRPRDELTAITSWGGGAPAGEAVTAAFGDLPGIRHHEMCAMTPTLRPTLALPPTRQGNFAFRWFETPAAHFEEFLALSAKVWPDFESSYDSQVIGLWRIVDGNPADPANGDIVTSLLLTRRPDLAMWERSKIPQGEKEIAMRETFNRRYDLCDSTVVYTTTLLTARDREDTARWT
jgi:hypothetical protein